MSYIYYPCDRTILWFSYDSLIKRYKENAIASIQRHPEIQHWKSEEEKQQCLRRKAVKRAKIPWETVELPRNKEGNYIIGRSVRRYQEHLEARLDEEKDMHYGRSREILLRWFYVIGAIKITILGKVFWVVEETKFGREKILCPPQTSRGAEQPQPQSHSSLLPNFQSLLREKGVEL